MTEVAATSRERISRRQVDKFAERRSQLASVALHTLARLGYARTSLRDIAQNSEFSHGVLHYYFSNKQELLMESVRQYEAQCVTRYDDIVASARSSAELRHDFSAAMANTLVTDATMHRLYYDLRNQSMFEESFRAEVLEIDQRREGMIWNVVSRYAGLTGITLDSSPAVTYAIFDGIFQHALLRHLAGHGDAASELRDNVAHILDCLPVVGLARYRDLPARTQFHSAMANSVHTGCSEKATAGSVSTMALGEARCGG